jgi:hypothetical protein
LSEFGGPVFPPYAILSHTWGDDEVSFQDIQSESCHTKAGYEKIQQCCKLAAEDGFEYAWVDTCCIDKMSSAELSEAINSMFRWYEHSEVCYVYLSDVPSEEDPQKAASAFSRSRWFTRGWTLQEIIAPSNVIFYGRDWEEVGTKSTLLSTISEITGIHADVLAGGDLETFSIAQRMSWASTRDTSRMEDLAYCLMGLFSVHMPMIYGEGKRAFIRLQEEIMKTSDDHTIFAWNPGWSSYRNRGLLAPSPEFFADSGTFVRSMHPSSTPFTSTNRGINLMLPLQALDTQGQYLAVLNCKQLGKNDHWVAVPLSELWGEADMFSRGHKDRLQLIEASDFVKLPHRSIFVRQERRQKYVGTTYNKICIDETGLQEHGVSHWESYPRGWLQPDNTVGSTMSLFDGLGGGIGYQISEADRFFIVFKLVKNHLSVNVEVVGREESAEGIFYSFNRVHNVSRPTRREWKNEPDRIIRLLPTGRLFIAIRKQMAKRRRTFVVHLSFTPHSEIPVRS